MPRQVRLHEVAFVRPQKTFQRLLQYQEAALERLPAL